MSLIISTPPIGPAVDPEVVKRHLGIEHSADDETVLELIEAATELIQEECGIQLLDAVCTQKLDRFPCGRDPVELQRQPVTSIEGVTYVDASGDQQELDAEDYQFDGDSVPARIVPAAGTCWPSTQCDAINAVTIQFHCGAEDVDSVSAAARKLIIYLCARWYEHRLPIGSPPAEDPFYRRQLDLLRWM